MGDLINYKAVCRSAPAIPGLINMSFTILVTSLASAKTQGGGGQAHLDCFQTERNVFFADVFPYLRYYSQSRSQFFWKICFLFPFPKVGILTFHSHSQYHKLGIGFAISHSQSQTLGTEFSFPFPIPKVGNRLCHFPFPFPNVQKSFPLMSAVYCVLFTVYFIMCHM